MNTYKKHKGGGVVMVNQESNKDSCPEEHLTKDLSSNPARDLSRPPATPNQGFAGAGLNGVPEPSFRV